MQTLPIAGYPLYGITDGGQVWSDRRSRYMRPATNRLGYIKQPLVRADGVTVCVSVHRLVALAFIPNPLGLPEVDHIDGNKANSAAGNLRWVTHKQNIANAMAMRGNWLTGSTRRSRAVWRTDPDTGERVKYPSIKAAGEALHAAAVAKGGAGSYPLKYTGNISKCASGITAISYGYSWSYR